jgi:anthranilate phosphoribosyltransferase
MDGVRVRAALAALLERRDLSEAEMQAVCEELLDGGATPAQIGALLMALRMKGETSDELAAVARLLRARMVPVAGAPPGAIDTCGTGGDGASSFNVSTAAGLIAAGAGVSVAKHGNRAASSLVGSADVLEALGVTLTIPPAALAECLAQVGFAFMLAPLHHPALRAVAAPRRELGVRTLFNLVGPLVNPAGVTRQVIGVADPRLVDVVAAAVGRLGTVCTWVVYGAGGLDELSLAGETAVTEVTPRGVRAFRVSPADAGVGPASVAALRVGSLAEAVNCMTRVLGGEAGPMRDAACLNAAAALMVGGVVADLATGVARARAAIDSGAAVRVLADLVAFTGARREGAA